MRLLSVHSWLAALALAGWMSLGATPSLANEPPAHDAPAAHGGSLAEDPAAGTEHEGEAHESGSHGGAHHVDYLADDDGDGRANWRDSTDDRTGEPNPDYQISKLGWHLFNLALLVGVLVWAVRRPVVDGIKNRALAIRKELTDAARMRDEARQRHEELGLRLSRFEEEVKQLRAEAEADAKAEEAKLIERAHAEAERIKQTAERNIRDELSRAQFALRKEAVDLAVKLAEQTLRREVRAEDQRRLARQFLDSLNEEGGNGHG